MRFFLQKDIKSQRQIHKDFDPIAPLYEFPIIPVVCGIDYTFINHFNTCFLNVWQGQ